MWETQVQSLDREDPLDKGMVTHSIILPWREFHGTKDRKEQPQLDEVKVKSLSRV